MKTSSDLEAQSNQVRALGEKRKLAQLEAEKSTAAVEQCEARIDELNKELKQARNPQPKSADPFEEPKTVTSNAKSVPKAGGVASSPSTAKASPAATSRAEDSYAYGEDENIIFEHTLALPLPFKYGRFSSKKDCRRVVVNSVDTRCRVAPQLAAGDVIYRVGRQLTIPMLADDVIREIKTACTNARAAGVVLTFWRPPPRTMPANGLRKSLLHLPALIKWRNVKQKKNKSKLKAGSRPPLKDDASGCIPMQGHLNMKNSIGYATGRRYFKLLNGKLNFANSEKEIDDSNKLRGSINLYQVGSVLRVKTEIELKFAAESNEKPLKLRANSTDKAKSWFTSIKERCDWLRS